jgi:hypothetical protein
VAPLRTKPAIKINVRARKRFAKRIILCREKRSKIVPTSGPIREYGSRTTAKAAAADLASGCLSGEKRTKEASADWNIPSVIWPVQRSASNLRIDGIFIAAVNLIRRKRSYL